MYLEYAKISTKDTSSIYLIFKDNGEEVHKEKTINDDLGPIPTIVRSIREAERDFAYRKYGNDWKNHVECRRFWSSDLNDKEKELVDKALKLIKDIDNKL